MNDLERYWVETGLALAIEAHKGQVDKAGEPYFLHFMRVGMAFKEAKKMTLGFIHDVLEDTTITADDLRAAGLPEDIIRGAIAISKVRGESNDAYLSRVEKDDLARPVKIVDLKDNSNLKRLKVGTEKHLARQTKYKKSIARLIAYTLDSQL